MTRQNFQDYLSCNFGKHNNGIHQIPKALRLLEIIRDVYYF